MFFLSFSQVESCISCLSFQSECSSQVLPKVFPVLWLRGICELEWIQGRQQQTPALCCWFPASFCSPVGCSAARDCRESAFSLVLAKASLLLSGRCCLIKMKIFCQHLSPKYSSRKAVIWFKTKMKHLASALLFVVALALAVMILVWCDPGVCSEYV